MRTIITIVTATVLLLTGQTAVAAASKQENIGVGSGALVGALAGGPVGLIVGAAIGAKVGDTMHRKSERIESLQGELQASQRHTTTLQHGIAELNREIDALRDVAQPELIRLMQAGIDMDLLFRTDEAALTDSTGQRLAEMAATVAAMPDVRIQLDGFADERGDAAYNHGLSERRVEFVRKLFVDAGVHPARISGAAHGESVAQDTNIDSYALERRVSVKLFIEDERSVASVAH